MEPLAAFFLICFLFGAAFTLVSLVTGTAHFQVPGLHGLHLPALHGLHGGHPLHVHAGGHGSSEESLSPANLGSLLAFLTWFGGVGFLLSTLSPLAAVLAVVLALIAGVIGAGFIMLFLARVLLPAQTTVDRSAYQLEGTPARVTASIAAGQTGEITYSKAGTRRSDAARSIDGEPIARGEEVVIVAYRRGVAYVQTMKRYLGTPAAGLAGRITALERDGAPDDEP